MKLYANGILLNAAAQSVTLEKSRGDAAATLTAVLLTAAADRYFPKESLPVGTLEVPAGWKRLVAGAGVRAFDILRQAVGEDREISIQNGALTVTKAGQERFVIAEETVLASRGTADARQMVNRCAVIDRRGAAAATAQNTTDLARFGLRQRVLGKSGDAAAQAQGGLRGRILRGELTVRGDLRYRCGALVELHRKEFGLDGAYPLTAVKHRWERGLFTTELTWEGEA